jgi:hypothetical protein
MLLVELEVLGGLQFPGGAGDRELGRRGGGRGGGSDTEFMVDAVTKEVWEGELRAEVIDWPM